MGLRRSEASGSTASSDLGTLGSLAMAPELRYLPPEEIVVAVWPFSRFNGEAT